MDEVTRLRGEASAVGEQSTKLQESLPGLLSGLKQNLSSIFSKDNPMIQAREGALSNYLSSADNARAEFLPYDQPIIEGQRLNYSPTQLNSMVSSRQSAALAPLLGLNQSIVSQYGNLGDILSNASTLYQSQIEAAKQRAAVAQQAFTNALAQEKESREGRTAAGSGFGDLSSILALLGLGGGSDRPGIETFDQPNTLNLPSAVASGGLTLGGGTPGLSMPLTQNQPSWWDNLLGALGATPKEGQNAPTGFSQSLAGSGLTPGARIDFGGGLTPR